MALSSQVVSCFLSEFGEEEVAATAVKSLQSCLTVRPRRRQPTRLARPWDSPGKNTGVGCHFLLQCRKVKSESEVRVLATPWPAAHQVPASMGFSRQEYRSGVPLPSPGGGGGMLKSKHAVGGHPSPGGLLQGLSQEAQSQRCRKRSRILTFESQGPP